ncbi:MAG: imidazole glycerol phosphate synthase subunit HisH [Alphaproteobacteria bacterium]
MPRNNPTIAIIDYGYGNIFSVNKALTAVGGNVMIISQPIDLEKNMPRIDKIILPGQGAFPACRRALSPFLATLLPAITDKKKPLLGICVGMQLLADDGFEFETISGLGLIKGQVRSFQDIWQKNKKDFSNYNLPQMAWNKISIKQPRHPLMTNIENGNYFYFVHSFAFDDYKHDDVVAMTHYGIDYPMVVARGNVAGIQCHPEKSQLAGLQFLKNFLNWDGGIA